MSETPERTVRLERSIWLLVNLPSRSDRLLSRGKYGVITFPSLTFKLPDTFHSRMYFEKDSPRLILMSFFSKSLSINILGLLLPVESLSWGLCRDVFTGLAVTAKEASSMEYLFTLSLTNILLFWLLTLR